jgi:hypothetical protein
MWLTPRKNDVLSDVNDQFIVKVAATLEDAVKLMGVGFEYHAEAEGHNFFRKRKNGFSKKTNAF